jgi:hypothetical protein
MKYAFGKCILNISNHVIFPAKIQYRCIRVYAWFKDDKHVIWMWIWLILNKISLLDRIWSLRLVRFTHSPTNFIFWLGRLIFLRYQSIHIQITYTYLIKCKWRNSRITVEKPNILKISLSWRFHCKYFSFLKC